MHTHLTVELAAVAAHVPDALVYLLVRAHVVPQPEALPAEAALVVLLAGVGHSVPPQLLLLLEALAASLALERPQVGVVHHVHLQLLPTLGLEAAQVALHVVLLLLLPFLEPVSKSMHKLHTTQMQSFKLTNLIDFWSIGPKVSTTSTGFFGLW